MFVVKQSNSKHKDESSNLSSRQDSSLLPSFNELLTSINFPTELRHNSTAGSISDSTYIRYNGISGPREHRRTTTSILSDSQSTCLQPSFVIIKPLQITATMATTAEIPINQNNHNPYPYPYPYPHPHPHPYPYTYPYPYPYPYPYQYQYQYQYQLLPKQPSQQQQQQKQQKISINSASVPETSPPSQVQLPLKSAHSSSSSRRSVERSNSMNSINRDSMTSATSVSNDLKRKHICKVCSRSFTVSSHLSRHKRIHTGERKHVCPWPLCVARFSRPDNCMQHYKTHINGKNRLEKSTKKCQ
ncbi:hypothetical protein DFJ63DRAFT_337267 [Scheffersomyces coipomensis]|uniref:uncharacterized protein n=1 Tax=Scheffersomyces coipomensis TaxID=1788519 RepID=UPI00315CB42A